jgi:hypothetical protein
MSGRTGRLQRLRWRSEAVEEHQRNTNRFRYRGKPVKRTVTPEEGSPQANGGGHRIVVGGREMLEQGC